MLPSARARGQPADQGNSTELDAEKRLALQEEKQELEHKLLDVPKLRDRLEELKAVKTERERARAAQ